MGINAEYMGTVRFGPPTENIASSKMKCFLVFATLAVAAHALPQYYIADTPEVQAAKAQFAAAWNAAAARNAAPVAPIHHAAAPVAPVAVAVNANFEDGESYPAAEPYVHVDIPAEPYVHEEIEAEPYQYIAGPSAPAAPVAPVAPVTFNNVIAGVSSGCFNYKGE